jgi:hypothetical protein
MELTTIRFPFEVPFSEVQANPDPYVSVIFSSLESEFLTLPKGPGFVEYAVFERGYEALKQATSDFQSLTPDLVLPVALSAPVSMVVLRSMLGFTPPEWAFVAAQHTGADLTQGFARTLDREVRMAPLTPLQPTGKRLVRLRALIETACRLLADGAPSLDQTMLHRLDKADTKSGPQGIRTLGQMGVPYAMVLYERFLGRPFASHRDSISELVGDNLEIAIEDALTKAGISYRKTKRAERVEGFDQTPDFIVPSEFNPQVVIEAKVTEDDGTARDKITRIQHLGELSMAGQPSDRPKYQVVACIAGRGFGIRREDMKKLLLATHGKVFTLKTLSELVENTRLKDFRTE